MGYDSPTVFDVFDLNGKLLFTSSDLPFAEKLRGDCSKYAYGKGLYCIPFENTTDYPEKRCYSGYGEYAFHLMNEAGELVAGPYYCIGSLTEELIAAMIESGDFVYLDRNGEVVSEVYPQSMFPDNFYWGNPRDREFYPENVTASTNDFYSRLYTADGELFFSYPIATMDD